MKASLKTSEPYKWWEDPRLEKAIRMLHTDNPKTIALPNDGSATDWTCYCTKDSKAVRKLAESHGQKVVVTDVETLNVLSAIYAKAPVMYGASYKDTPKSVTSKEKWVMYSGELRQLYEGFESRVKKGTFFD